MAFTVTQIGKREWKQGDIVGDFKYRYMISTVDAGDSITLCNPGGTSSDVTNSTTFGNSDRPWSIVSIHHSQPEAYTLTIKSGTTTLAVYNVSAEQSMTSELEHKKVIEEALNKGDDLVLEFAGDTVTNMEIQVVDQWLL